MQKFKLANQAVIDRCIAAIRQAEGKMVIISDDESRSQAQNRLYWQWVACLADELGLGKDELHIYFKRRFLAKIYAKDDADFAKMADAVHHCKRHLSTQEYEAMAVAVASIISTTKATTEQFGEYLTDIENWAVQQGCILPVSDDLLWVRDE